MLGLGMASGPGNSHAPLPGVAVKRDLLFSSNFEEADSQLELVRTPEGWDEESSALLRLEGWWLNFEPNPHFRFPPFLLLSLGEKPERKD